MHKEKEAKMVYCMIHAGSGVAWVWYLRAGPFMRRRMILGDPLSDVRATVPGCTIDHRLRTVQEIMKKMLARGFALTHSIQPKKGQSKRYTYFGPHNGFSGAFSVLAFSRHVIPVRWNAQGESAQRNELYTCRRSFHFCASFVAVAFAHSCSFQA
jgi:hypothetical protein